MRTLISLMVAVGAVISGYGQERLAGTFLGTSELRLDEELGVTVVGIDRSQVAGFQDPRRGVVRSTIVAGEFLGVLSFRDVIRIRGQRVVFRTTLDPFSCGCDPSIEVAGRGRLRGREIRYQADSNDGRLTVQGTIRIRRRVLVRNEVRVYEDEVITLRSESDRLALAK